jgi:hypothetical protein
MKNQEIYKELAEFLSKGEDITLEEMKPELTEVMFELIWNSIPDVQKQQNGDDNSKKEQLKSMIKEQLDALYNEKTSQNEKTFEKLQDYFKSEINTEIIFLIKLFSMIYSDEKAQKINNIFKKYKPLREQQIKLQAKYFANTFLSGASEIKTENENFLKELYENIISLDNEIKSMIERDTVDLINLVIEFVREDVKNPEAYVVTHKSKKINLKQVLADVEQNKKNQHFIKFVQEIFVHCIPVLTNK